MEGRIVFNKFLPLLQSMARNRLTTTAAGTAPIVVQKRYTSSNKGLHHPKSVYEPDYLESLKPEYPQYASLNVAIKGYDFPILENYQKYLHSVAEYLDLDVSDCYALPAQKTTVQRLRPNSAVVETEYNLTMYERNLQLDDVDAPKYPLFLRIAQAALPEGVTLQIQEHTDECEERRYVPDRDLLELKAELDRMTAGMPQSKKK